MKGSLAGIEPASPPGLVVLESNQLFARTSRRIELRTLHWAASVLILSLTAACAQLTQWLYAFVLEDRIPIGDLFLHFLFSRPVVPIGQFREVDSAAILAGIAT